jgi:hypothetical protein
MNEFSEIAKNWGLLVSAIAGVFGLFFVYLQYRDAQRWKKTQIAAELIEKLFRDEDTIIALRILDGQDGKAFLPTKYRGKECDPFEHNLSQLADAMSKDVRWTEPATGITGLKPEYRGKDLGIYVAIFDSFFEQLERIEALVRTGLIAWSDLRPLSYWLSRIKHAHHRGRPIFDWYLEHYRYEGVRRMAQHLGREDMWSRQLHGGSWWRRAAGKLLGT